MSLKRLNAIHFVSEMVEGVHLLQDTRVPDFSDFYQFCWLQVWKFSDTLGFVLCSLPVLLWF